MKQSSDPKQNTILVVDDDSYICIFLKTVLEKEGFKVESASNGDEALKVVEKIPVHCIILDWMMPVLSGFDVLKTLKKGDKKEIPVMVVTAHISDQSTINMILNELNASDFMTKPIDYKQFVARVHKILNTVPVQR